jgi:hypothetical protein
MSIFIEDRIAGAKVRTMAPISQNTFEESTLVTIANDEMLLKLVSDLMSVREEYFLASKSVSIVSGVDHYGIPARAVGNSMNALFFVDGSGQEVELNNIEASRRAEFAGQCGTPRAFYFEGDEVVLLPKPSSSSGRLLFQYFRKPGRLTLTSTCAKITGVSTVGALTTFTVDTDLTSSLPVGSLVDVVCRKSPFLLWSEDVAVLAIASNQIQISKASVSDPSGAVEPQVGDFICPAGYSNIPMIPEEFHPVLDQMMAVRLLAGLGDLEKWNAAKAELKEVRAEALRMVKNRVQATPKRFGNRRGVLRAVQRKG